MRFFILFILLFPWLAYAQIDTAAIYGTWIKTKAEMKDGSRIIDRFGTQSGFLVNSFTKYDTAFFTNYPMLKERLKFKYKIINGIINVGGIKYQIIKLANDSLIFMDIDPGLSDDKIRKFYFTKMESHHNYDKPVYNDAIKDSVYNVTSYIFPQSAGAIESITTQLEPLLKTLSANGNLKLMFIINKNGQLKDLNVLENDSLSKIIEQKVINAFLQTQELWFPAYVNNKAANVIVEFAVTFNKNNMFRYLNMSYKTSLFKQEQYKAIPIGMMDQEGYTFNRGVSLAKRHKYDEALVQLTKCLEIDEINLDAYYLRAAINLKLGNKKAACDDWEKLAQLGQVPAIKCLAQYCNN